MCKLFPRKCRVRIGCKSAEGSSYRLHLSAGLKGSTALSQAVVTGGALASFMYSSFKRHPDDHKMSLIDFDLALILTPMLLLGITAGKAQL